MNDLDQNSLEYALKQFIKLHHARTHQLLGKLGLYPGQPRILFMLWTKNGRTQKEFADKLQLAPATITVMLQRMEKAGLIERQSDPDDLRISRVYLTEAGRNIRNAVEEVYNQLNEISFSGLTPEERMILRRLMLQMADNLSKYESPQTL